MDNLILLLVIAAIIGLAVAYIVREKKRGVRCIGCPAAGSCPHCSGAKHKANSAAAGGKHACGCGCGGAHKA